MADDFTGVPEDRWWRMSRDTTAARLLAVIALALAVLLILTLIEKGILTGWSDILRPAHDHG